MPLEGENRSRPDVVDLAIAEVSPTPLVNSPVHAKNRSTSIPPQFRAPVRWGINE